MPYTPQVWKNKGVDGAIAINDDNLNYMETGIDDAHKAIDDVTTGHHHDGADSRLVTHTDLLAKGTNTHSVIDAKIVESDAHIAAANPHSGSASDANLSAHTDATNPHSSSAKSGANSDITQLSGLTTDLSIAQGGTGQSTASAAFDALKQSATETYAGVTERATTVEDVTGTATDVATTPAGLTERLKSPGAIGETSPSTGSFTTLQSQKQSVITTTDNYDVQITDFGKTIRVNVATDDKAQSLPSVGATEDGSRITFVKTGAGRLTIGAEGTDKFFGGSAGGTVYNDVASEIGASVTIEYVDAITMWAFVSANGTWVVT